jgi:antitoxin (DNA-binding transcriptional repressor) of toxin-antitoxin stability system
VKYVATRELRNRPGAFQELVDDEDVILTSSGKPFALVMGVDDENVEETVHLVRRVRAEQALSRLRKRAAEQGLDRLTGDEVEKEVQAARRARGRRG